MKKIALFAFNGDFLSFIHILLNALDMKEKGYDVKIVIEGSATKIIPELAKEGIPMYELYRKARELDLIDGACQACSHKMGTLEAVKAEDVRLLGDMKGHPGIGRYR
jgi:hypothetical protein